MQQPLPVEGRRAYHSLIVEGESTKDALYYPAPKDDAAENRGADRFERRRGRLSECPPDLPLFIRAGAGRCGYKAGEATMKRKRH